MSNMVFGTSGWSYKSWVGPFYQTPVSGQMFTYYSRFFNTAEINSTFYSYPSKRMIQNLERKSPSSFIFSLKIPKIITHNKKLRQEEGVKTDLMRFIELLDPLSARGKLGCMLIQLPPRFTYEHNYQDFSEFLELLPRGYEFAAEFRHNSWIRDDTLQLLKEHNVAYCIVDEPVLPPNVYLTADFAYFRWHGRGVNLWYDYEYTREELQEWVPKIEEAGKKVNKVYGYFNNHFHGYAIENCIEFMGMLGESNPKLENVKNRITNYNSQKKPFFKEKKLEDFSFS